MTYKTIAVYVNDSRHTMDRVQVAARLALAHRAHLVGVAATGIPETFYMGGVAGEGMAGLNVYLDFVKERAATTLAAFELVAARAGVSSFEKRAIEDEAGAALCLQARYSDLLVIGQPDPDEGLPAERSDVAQYVLLNGGRPVLLVPYAGSFDAIGRRAVIAWDGSPEAARAVTGAIPLLRESGLVQVAVFNPEIGYAAHGEEPGADIALYLARHDIKVEVARQTTDRHVDLGNALLSHVADFGADLLVMGGYGHARLREVLLGGVTRTVLTSMTIPVLMSH